MEFTFSLSSKLHIISQSSPLAATPHFFCCWQHPGFCEQSLDFKLFTISCYLFTALSSCILGHKHRQRVGRPPHNFTLISSSVKMSIESVSLNIGSTFRIFLGNSDLIILGWGPSTFSPLFFFLALTRF